MQVDIRLQHDRSCEPHALRNDQATATLLRECINCLGKSVGVQSHTIVNGTEVAQVNLTVRELRSFYLRHLEGQILGKTLVGILTLCTCFTFFAVVLLCRGSQCDA